MLNLVEVAKGVAKRFPRSWQLASRRLRYRYLIRTGRFASDEPELAWMAERIGEGDWVIDVGANIGSYTLPLSRLVGPGGRILAFEPVPTTFQLLTRHVGGTNSENVTLLNLAASDRCKTVRMHIPEWKTGLENLYRSKVSEDGSLEVLAVPLDALNIDASVCLIKIDVEGHEMNVLRGASRLINRDRPVIVLEGDTDEFAGFLGPLGYTRTRLPGSPNTVYVSE